MLYALLVGILDPFGCSLQIAGRPPELEGLSTDDVAKISALHMFHAEKGLTLVLAEAKQLFFCNLTESDLRSDSPVV